MANFVSFVGPTDLENARAIVPEGYERDLFNDMGFVLRAKTETGEDLYIWMFMYRQLGTEVIINNEVCQTLMVNVKFADEEKSSMRDTPYINKGQNLDDYHKVGTLKFSDTEDSNTWTLAGRVFRSEQQKKWKVTGEHAGVRVDLHYTQRGDAFYNGHRGAFDDLKSGEGHAAFIVHCYVTGTVTVSGKTMSIYEGHERICMAGHVPERIQFMKARGMNWMNGWGKDISWYMKTADRGRSSTCMLIIDGETMVVYGGENAWIEEIGFWLDPKTNQMNPCKWKVWALTEKGRLDATVSAYGRAYYTWVRAGGTILVHQYVADCEAKFTRKDGTVTEEKQMASNEYMRTLYLQETK